MHNRLTGEYLCQDGRLTPSESEATIWIIEADEEAVRILDRESGLPLLRLNGSWTYGGFDFATKENAGWYTISTSQGKHLYLKDGKATVGESDRNTDYSAHWSFVRLRSENLPYIIGPDFVRESSFLGERTATALSPTEIVSDYHGPHTWKLTADISALPKFSAKGNTLLPALYNMALEESLLDIRPQDNTFMAGMLWPDTWTRDIVYSIYFAYSWLFPDISRKTLEKQTLKNPSEALQDTGSGGSYPVSTDRVVWAIAAWEYYLATGDKGWLAQAYEGLGNTARKDLHIAYDPEVHLFKGETCSMDWRT
ncbi:MAG: carbohydrate-binding protein, partial [Bacteroidales bacterium]|nr:carbohydrate-binding protein [Bacteroidales bacterium]